VKRTKPTSAAYRTTANNRRFQARALAVMFGAGSLLALAALAVPHGDEVNSAAWAANAAVGLPVAALLFLIGERTPVRALHGLLTTGAAMVAVGMTFGNGGSASISAAFFFVWVALYVFWFFEWRIAVAHLASDAVLLAIGLAVVDTPGAPAVWLLVMGTAVVVGVVVALMRRELLRVATIDHLTGLPTRQVLDEVLAREIGRASRRSTPLCLAIVDIDGLKTINDHHGHPAGDRILRDAARAWRAALRDSDTLVRFGGDEFVAILPDCTIDQACDVFERGRSNDIPCSVGIARWDPGESVTDLFLRADIALYQAKQRGRAQVVVNHQAT
jgi:diguanylate cyclase (GGDEF)-like protein